MEQNQYLIIMRTKINNAYKVHNSAMHKLISNPVTTSEKPPGPSFLRDTNS